MNLSEIADLIEIRNYISGAINNFNLKRETSRELQSMLILTDKRISEKLLSENFKEFIGFKDAAAAVIEAAGINNIKSGMKPSDSTVVIDAGRAHLIK